MLSGHPGTPTMMRLSSWNAFDFINNNFGITPNYPKVRPEICPNLGPRQGETTSDHESEARETKIDSNETGDSPNVTLSS